MTAPQDTLYRGYHIYYDPPPIPIRTMDWHFVHDDYDGAPLHADDGPSDHRCGSAASEQACRDEIDMIEDEDALVCTECGAVLEDQTDANQICPSCIAAENGQFGAGA